MHQPNKEETSRICIGGGSFLHEMSKKEIEKFANQALDLGVGALDLAPSYGFSEENFGKVSKLNRFMISSKISNPGVNLQSAADMKKSIHNSLQVLGLPYLDKIFIHSADFDSIEESHFEVLQDLKDKGDFGSLGYSGDNKNLSLFSKHPLISSLLCSFNIVDVANWPIIKNSNKSITIKRSLANRVWRPSIRQHLNELRLGNKYIKSEYQSRFENLYGKRSYLVADSHWITQSINLLSSLNGDSFYAVGTSSIKNLEALRKIEKLAFKTPNLNIDDIYESNYKFSNGEWPGLM